MKIFRGNESQTGRVNSNNELIFESDFFQLQNKKSLPLEDLLVLVAATFFSVLFFAFLFFVNTTWASDITKDAVITLTNSDRVSSGLPELKENPKLSIAASEKAADMIAKNYFAHTSPAGLTPWHWMEKEKYDYDYAGENLAMDFMAVKKMNDAWLASPTHRANILGEKYRDIGIGIAEGSIDGHDTIAVVQMFGSGDNSPQAPAEKKNSVTSATDDRETNDSTLPALPSAKAGKILFSSYAPIITFPVNGSTMQKENMSIMGRALPGTTVDVYDIGKFVGKSVADQNGWFEVAARSLGLGTHSLTLRDNSQKRSRVSVAGVGQTVSFAVDDKAPRVDYQMASSPSTASSDYLLNVEVDKSECVATFGGREISLGSGREIMLAAPKNLLSAVLKIEDSAGNKTFKFANFTNYAPQDKPHTAIHDIAEALTGGQDIASSGREALANNLGIKLADANH